MTKKFLLLIFFLPMLFACGGGGNGSSAAIAPDLSLTIRVDDADIPFETTIGPNGASIALRSGQRLEIRADTPVVFDVGANGASTSISVATSTVWDGVIASPVDTTIRFGITALANPDRRMVVNVLVEGRG